MDLSIFIRVTYIFISWSNHEFEAKNLLQACLDNAPNLTRTVQHHSSKTYVMFFIINLFLILQNVTLLKLFIVYYILEEPIFTD